MSCSERTRKPSPTPTGAQQPLGGCFACASQLWKLTVCCNIRSTTTGFIRRGWTALLKGLCLPSSFHPSISWPYSMGSDETLPQRLKPQPEPKAAEPLKKSVHHLNKPWSLIPAHPGTAKHLLHSRQLLPGKQPCPIQTLSGFSTAFRREYSALPPMSHLLLIPPPLLPVPRLPFSPSRLATVRRVSLAHSLHVCWCLGPHCCPESSHYPRSRLASTFCTHSGRLLQPRRQIPSGKPWGTSYSACFHFPWKVI